MAMTLVDEPLSRMERLRRRRRRTARRRGAVAVAALVAGGAGLAWATTHGAPVRGHHGAAGSSPPASIRASATAPGASAASVPVTAAGAAGALVHDIESGVAAGSIAPADGRSLIALVGAALVAAPPAPPAQALNAVASVSDAITTGLRAGTISASSASTLRGHLDRLALSMGVAPPGAGAPGAKP